MHKYLRAIGFSDYHHYKEIQELLNQVFESPDEIEVSDLLDSTFVTMEKDFGEQMGIGIFGEYDQTDRFQIEYYYPYYRGKTLSSTSHCSVSRRADRSAFSVMSEDYRLGISLIFYLQNTGGYLTCANERIPLNQKLPIYMSGMSTNGRILLPLKKAAAERKDALVTAQNRLNLIESAKKGDESAIESLTMYDIEQYNQAIMRIRTEDLYTVIDTCFMPAGMECDQYAIIGTILEIEEITNTLTKEEIYRFLVESNQIEFNILINKKDLLGEPAIGRRFKGDVWMQGHVTFPEAP